VPYAGLCRHRSKEATARAAGRGVGGGRRGVPCSLGGECTTGGAAGGACDIQVVNQIDTKFRCRICKQDMVYTSVQNNKGYICKFQVL
jgi:hypothetical protein